MTKEQFEYWKSLPETQEVFAALDAEIKEIGEFVLNGNTIRESSDQTALETVGYIGRIRGLKAIMMMEFED